MSVFQKTAVAVLLGASLAGCSTVGNFFNREPEPPVQVVTHIPASPAYATDSRYLQPPNTRINGIEVQYAHNWLPGDYAMQFEPLDLITRARAAETLATAELAELAEPAETLAAAKPAEGGDASQPVAAPLEKLKGEPAFTVYFATNSSELTQAALLALNALPKGRYALLGYADPRGARDFNLRLSKRRAEAVRSWLIENRFEVAELHSCGEVTATPPAHWPQFRRVELIQVTEAVGAACAS